MSAQSDLNTKPTLWKRFQKVLASVAAGSLVAGVLVAVGVGVTVSQAAAVAPQVSAAPIQTHIAGEDIVVDVTIASGYAISSTNEDADQYNLSIGLVLSSDIQVRDWGTLGPPTVFPNPCNPDDRVIPGTYATVDGDCTVLGLEPADNPGSHGAHACQVPDGMQYYVFENISDLPKGASTTHQLTVRPNADVFPVGSPDLDLQFTAYTSSDERFLPLFPGSTGVAEDDDDTSEPGGVTLNVPVNALRVEKSEPSPESELLRGVHDNTTTYTIRVYHTGEGDLTNTTVVDYLPAGLEYLSQGGDDHSTNANGNRGNQSEYDGAASLSSTPAPAGDQATNSAVGREVSVITLAHNDPRVHADANLAPGVYTQVTWNLADLVRATDSTIDITQGVEQDFAAGGAGSAGYFEIRYRAGIPLFENTLDFGYVAAEDGQQGSNLDNNRGASTRHGFDPAGEGNADAKPYINTAMALGTYAGALASDTEAAVSDSDTEHVDAVDVRLLKSVVSGGAEDNEFYQGNNARYTLNIATSEYTSADLNESGQSPLRLVDDLADGLCPVFPAGTPITDGASTHDGLPNLAIGNPNPDTPGAYTENYNLEDWNAALQDAGVGTDCAFPSDKADETDDALENASLSLISFDPVTGHFFLGLSIDPIEAGNGDGVNVRYSALQNTEYVGDPTNENVTNGATTSGDSITNEAEVYATTTAIEAVRNLPNQGGHTAGDKWEAWDDSEATLTAPLTSISKQLLPRNVTPYPTRDNVANATGWEDESDVPFAIGDEVWWKINVDPPAGVDLRNPKLVDFLPVGVEFDDTKLAPGHPFEGRYESIVMVPHPEARDLGSCTGLTPLEWLTEFVPNPDLSSDKRVLTWEFGSSDCLPGDDRFMPILDSFDVYIKTTVTDAAAFGEVDLPQNLAKYQQNNVSQSVHFLRDQAEMRTTGGVRLIKGIEDNTHAEGTTDGIVNSNIDGEEVVQGDKVTFRLDVTGPAVDTTGYYIYDALPEGIQAADIVGYDPADHTIDSSGVAWEGSSTSATAITHEALAYDWDDLPDDLDIHAAYENRTIVVWHVTGTVPASTINDENLVERGVTLSYTITIPDEDAANAALVSQNYTNTASIVEYSVVNNGSGTTRLLPQTGSTNPNAQVPTGGSDDGAGNVEDGQTAIPVGTRPVDTDGVVVSGDLATDPSDVFLPTPKVEKNLISTEVGPDAAATPAGLNNLDSRNGNHQIAQGELATFEYSVTIPANTTVRDGELTDDRVLRWTGNPNVNGRELAYHLESAKVWNAPGVTNGTGTLDSGWLFDDETGTLTFPEYFDAGNADQTISVRVTVWIDARDADHPNNALFPDFGHNKLLQNTAGFRSKNLEGQVTERITDTADVNFVRPVPTLNKAVTNPSSGVVAPAGEVTYELRASNASGTSTLYDVAVYDCVPVELENVVLGSAPAGSTATVLTDKCAIDEDGDIERGTGDGTLIEWEIDKIEGTGTSVVLSYTATVDPEAGGGASYTNYAELEGYTLPSIIAVSDTTERRGNKVNDADATVRLTSAGITKSVAPDAAPVGDTVTYTVTTTLPANANYYDVTLTDVLPDGIEYLETVSTNVNWAGAPNEPTLVSPTAHASTLEWTFEQSGAPVVDFATHTEARTITVTYTAKITDEVTDVEPENVATLTWNTVKGVDTTQQEEETTSSFEIINPELMITKKVDGEDSIERNPDASFLYTLVVEQTANGATPAHNITVQDVVPAGVKVDTTQAALTDATFSNASDLAEGLGGTITWVLDGPLNPRGATADTSIELSYTATFVDSEELSAQSSSYPEGYPYLNVADVTRYESFDDDGWVYEPGTTGNKSSKNPGGGPDIPRITDDADVTPLFPHVVPVKTVTSPVSGESYGIAVADQPFNWTLTIENRGEGIAQDISVTDTLPLNWSYDPGSAKINGVDLDDPQVVVDQTATEGQKITWTVEQLAPGTGGASVTPLAADGSFVITFDAIPSVAALDTPGTGIDVIAHVHRNSVSVTATDTQNNPENGDGDYVGDDDTADAYMAEANLLLEKITIGGVVDTGDTASNLYGLATGTWVPGQGVKNDAPAYAQPQWQITVTNQGPDADFGPFAIVDTETKPAGVVTGEWSAQYYPAGGGTPTPLTITGEGTVTNPFMVGDSTISLNSAGTDRIVLVADVTIPGNVTATGDDLSNMADVRGTVYEDPENFDDNDDETEKPLITVADLSIQKQFAETSDLNAGDSVSWTLTVTNNGPSDSVSSTAEPITVTDAVPAEIENVEMLDLTALPAGWEVDITGNDIELTLTPEAVFPASGAGSTVDFVFTGDIKASVDAGTSITNEAEVHPGETPDPNPGNNEDEDEIEPITANTSVGANKYRVAFDEGSGTWLPLVEGTDATAGTEISYRIGITNTGKADARGVNLVDDLPAELDFVSWAAGSPTTGWVVDETADPLVFTHPDNLAPGAEAWVVVTVEVNESVTGPITNTVCIDDATGNWTEDSDDCASDTSNTDKLVDWELVKSHTVPAVDTPVYAGDTVRYLLQVHNHGPSASAGPITVTDVLPAGFSYADGAVVTGGTVEETIVEATTGDRTQVTWTINGPFATGTDVVTIAYDARAAEDIAPGTYVNNARVDGVEDGTEPGDDPGNNDDDDEVNVLRDATMRINKTVLNADDEWVDTAAYAAGTRATWQIEVINEGPSAVPVTFTDVLPSGLTMVTMEGTGWDCVVADLECEFTDNGGLHPVGSTFITLTSDIAASVQPTPAGESGLRNIGSIAWTDNTPDGDPDMDEDDAFITIYREADLGIVKTALDAEGAETARATAGASLWYSLVVRNEGPSDAVGPIVVHDTLPADVTFAGLTPESALVWEATVDRTGPREVVTFEPRETAPSPGIVVNGEAVEIRYEVELAATLSQDAVLVNDAVIDEDTLDENGDPTTDPDEAPDADTSTVTVDRLIDLGIVKSHDAEQVRIGDVLPFTLEVTNYGPSEASGIVVTDRVPAGLEVVSEVGPVLDEQGDPTGWTIDSIALAEPGDDTADPVIPANPAGGATVVASYASSLAPNETAAPLVIETLVTAAAYQTVTNVATVTGTEPEPNPDPNPNESEDPVSVPPMVELVIVKTAVSEFRVGKVGQYEITVTNNGPTEDPGPFTVVDHLPKGLSFNAASHDGAATAGDTVTWVIEEPLAVGESFTLTLDVNVHQAAYDQPNHEITNVVTVESLAEKTPESDLDDDETVTVKPADPLVVSGSDLAGGLLAAVALMLVLGAAAYATGRRGRGAHAA